MHSLAADLRYALRQLRSAPGFTLACVITLALGVGANTAVFSVMNAVLLRSLPVPHPEQVFHLLTSGLPASGTNTGDMATSFSYPVYRELQSQRQVFQSLSAFVPLSYDRTPTRIGDSPEEAKVDMTSGSFFSGLGVRMARGHGFNEQDEAQHSAVAVISYAFWTRRFSRDPSAIGQTISVRGVPLTIVGVAAEGFEGVEAGQATDIWLPMQSRPELNAWGHSSADHGSYLERPNWWCLRLVGRLQPGVNAQQAIAKLQPVFQKSAYIGLGEPHPGEHPPVLSFKPAKGFGDSNAQARKPIEVLMLMVSLVLLIALSNVAMLLVARNTGRTREFSLRLAVGAGRGRLFRQLLAEGLLLVTAGGLIAWAFAAIATRALASWAQEEHSLAPDHTVLLFTLAILLASAILFGLAPLRIAASAGPTLVLRTASSLSGNDARRLHVGKAVTVLQIGLCAALLAGGMLLVRTLRSIENTPTGMRMHGLVVFGITPQKTQSFAQGLAFLHEMMNRLRVLPGVESATVAENRPGSGWSDNFGIHVDGHMPASPKSDRGVRSNTIGSDYFHTLGIPVVQGREFTEADTATSQKVAIINKTFADHYLPGQNPIGHTVGDPSNTRRATIIGVVADHKYTGLQETAIPMLWLSYTQSDSIGTMQYILRTRGDPATLLGEARRAVENVDPNLPLQRPNTLQQEFADRISNYVVYARLSEFFAVLAALLVATGLYGTISYRVSRRTMEIGVRMSVGAEPAQILVLILRESLWLVLAGLALGTPLTLFLSRALGSILYGVNPYDPISYAAALAGIGLVAAVASLIPAQRAARVDPLVALRNE